MTHRDKKGDDVTCLELNLDLDPKIEGLRY